MGLEGWSSGGILQIDMQPEGCLVYYYVHATINVYSDYYMLHPPSYNKNILSVSLYLCYELLLVWFYNTNLKVSPLSILNLYSV